MKQNKKTKKVMVQVYFKGYVWQEMEIPDGVKIDENNMDELILDKFHFSEASDIADSIDWRMQYADLVMVSQNGEPLAACSPNGSIIPKTHFASNTL